MTVPDSSAWLLMEAASALVHANIDLESQPPQVEPYRVQEDAGEVVERRWAMQGGSGSGKWTQRPKCGGHVIPSEI